MPGLVRRESEQAASQEPEDVTSLGRLPLRLGNGCRMRLPRRAPLAGRPGFLDAGPGGRDPDRHEDHESGQDGWFERRGESDGAAPFGRYGLAGPFQSTRSSRVW